MSAITTQAPPRGDRVCRLAEWRPWPLPNNSLIGHLTVTFAGGWTISRIPVFRARDGALRVGVPSTAEIDAEGRIRKDRDGKRVYTSIITFETADARERWQRAVLAALAAGGISGELPP